MKNEKTCFDCLHCKVSAKSTKYCRLCFCAEAEVKKNHKETYWLAKPVCEKFDDMSEQTATIIIFPAIAVKRRHLLRQRHE
jgi:hypothetical protein